MPNKKKNIPNQAYHHPGQGFLFLKIKLIPNDSNAAILRNNPTGSTLLNFDTSLRGVKAYIHIRDSVDFPIMSSPRTRKIHSIMIACINHMKIQSIRLYLINRPTCLLINMIRNMTSQITIPAA